MISDYCSPLWSLHSYGGHRQFNDFENTNADDMSKNSKEINKLTKRFEESNKRYKKYMKSSNGKKIIFNKSKSFKCFARGVKLAKLSGGSDRCGAKTSRDLKKGEHIFISRPFASVVEPNESYTFKYCHTCHRSTSKEYIACNQCWSARFCSGYCKDMNRSHQFECGTWFRDISDLDIKLAIQMVLEAMSTFLTVNQLEKHITKVVESEILVKEHPNRPLPKGMKRLNKQIPTKCYDKNTQLDCIMCSINYDGERESCQKASLAYYMIMNFPAVANRFKTKGQRRFMKHLLLHFLNIVMFNSISKPFMVSSDKEVKRLERRIIYDAINFIKRTLHPRPNVEMHFINGNTIHGIAAEDIKAGQQLFINFDQLSIYYDKFDVNKEEN
ncbi:uncharacterized protein LOC116343099 [Contarinia nasturtii]|uniref:uncharacterized protein LOC116343099 n=1 Tax=Contarinia nasturtii TaxID=265458 RepID=UPI0012D43E72|nr:uncharacterized protein LOC116343099 [Contarinia nasturtii]